MIKRKKRGDLPAPLLSHCHLWRHEQLKPQHQEGFLVRDWVAQRSQPVPLSRCLSFARFLSFFPSSLDFRSFLAYSFLSSSSLLHLLSTGLSVFSRTLEICQVEERCVGMRPSTALPPGALPDPPTRPEASWGQLCRRALVPAPYVGRCRGSHSLPALPQAPNH